MSHFSHRYGQLNALEAVLLELAVAAAATKADGTSQQAGNAWAAAAGALHVRAAQWRAAVRARGRGERERERRRFEIALSAGGTVGHGFDSLVLLRAGGQVV